MTTDGLENFFAKFKRNIIGDNQRIKTSFHQAIPIVYADWTASGRMYAGIEERINKNILPFVANTHTDTNDTGMTMTYAYHKAQKIIKAHVGGNDDDVLISSNAGMTGVVNKFQRILGLKIHENFRNRIDIPENERPVIFITHMEHHSNQTSWLETIADVVIIPPNDNGLISISNFKAALEHYKERKTKYAAITSCSNVTGIFSPYMDIAEAIHEVGGYCFVDFASSAPYIAIDMHQNDESGRYLDAIYFSMHKFLGGPGTTGILVFNKTLYANAIPDEPGGGTVEWTNPWGKHKYIDNIEAREDGGTPAFLQTIKAAMCVQLKNEMGVENIKKREGEILDMIWAALEKIPKLHILAPEHKERLGIVAFYIDGLHHNLGVKMLNDKYGIQVRGGCSCAGTYGHYLFDLGEKESEAIIAKLDGGDCSMKPGWIRMSIHPTHSDGEIYFILEAIKQLALHHNEWSLHYDCDLSKNKIQPKDQSGFNAMKSHVDLALDAAFA